MKENVTREGKLARTALENSNSENFKFKFLIFTCSPFLAALYSFENGQSREPKC